MKNIYIKRRDRMEEIILDNNGRLDSYADIFSEKLYSVFVETKFPIKYRVVKVVIKEKEKKIYHENRKKATTSLKRKCGEDEASRSDDLIFTEEEPK